MNAEFGQWFPAGKLTGFVRSVCASGVLIRLARVSKSGSIQAFVGDLALLFRCFGSDVQMQLAIEPQYHKPKFLENLRAAVFSALDIPATTNWTLKVAPPVVIDLESDPSEEFAESTSVDAHEE